MNKLSQKNNDDMSFIKTERMVCYISLGSNLGNPEENLAIARKKLESTQGSEKNVINERPIYIEASSPIYHTEPQNLKEQPFFANQILKISCSPDITPYMLLQRLLGIENEMGRKRSLRFGPRIIDLDILFIEDVQIDTAELTLPHPRMYERAFVLVPLNDIASDLVLATGKCVSEVLQTLSFRVEGNVIYQE